MLNASDCSEPEDDTHVPQTLEATDPMLLPNDLFKSKENEKQTEKANKIKENNNDDISDEKKSQRYLSEYESDNGFDLHLSQAVQLYVHKKLNDIISKQVEFCVVPSNTNNEQKGCKSKVKLLNDAECYVKSHDDEAIEAVGPKERPQLKRRKLTNDNDEPNREQKLYLAAISGESILEGKEVKYWYKKPDRKDKVFHYKIDKSGKLQEKEVENEFTVQRRKNKWNEQKIRIKIKK